MGKVSWVPSVILWNGSLYSMWVRDRSEQLWDDKRWKSCCAMIEFHVINPRRACAARFTTVALIVCLSVITLAAASLGSTLLNRLFSVLTRGYIFEKTFRSRVMTSFTYCRLTAIASHRAIFKTLLTQLQSRVPSHTPVILHKNTSNFSLDQVLVAVPPKISCYY